MSAANTGRLLVATDDGLVVLDVAGDQPVVAARRLAGRALTAVTVVRDRIVVGARDGLAVSEDGERFHELHDGLSVRHVRALGVVREAAGERLLVGTEPAALFFEDGDDGALREAGEVARERDRLGWFLPYSPEAGCVRHFAASGERVYAAVEVGGLLRSDDGGRHARLAGGSDGVPSLGDPGGGRIHPDVHAVTVDPAAADHLWAATAGGVYESTDGGGTFSRRGPRWYVRDVVPDPDAAGTLIAGAADSVRDKQGRIEQSRDGGATWERAPGAEGPWPRAMVERFAATPAGLAAVRSDGALWLRGHDGRWQELVIDAHARDACAAASG